MIPSATEPTPPDFFVAVFFWRMASADEWVNGNISNNLDERNLSKHELFKRYLICLLPLFAFEPELPLTPCEELYFLSLNDLSSIRWKEVLKFENR